MQSLHQFASELHQFLPDKHGQHMYFLLNHLNKILTIEPIFNLEGDKLCLRVHSSSMKAEPLRGYPGV